jgi:hypothetical protein
VNDDKDTARSLADLVRLAEDTRAWSQALRADSVRVKRQVAQTEAALAATLARLARRQPHHADRLRTQSAEAANHAVRARRWAADRRQRQASGS